MEKNMEKQVYMCITESLCCTAELTQHCKSTILQFWEKKKKKKKDSHQSASKQSWRIDWLKQGEGRVPSRETFKPARTHTPRDPKRPSELHPCLIRLGWVESDFLLGCGTGEGVSLLRVCYIIYKTPPSFSCWPRRSGWAQGENTSGCFPETEHITSSCHSLTGCVCVCVFWFKHLTDADWAPTMCTV